MQCKTLCSHAGHAVPARHAPMTIRLVSELLEQSRHEGLHVGSVRGQARHERRHAVADGALDRLRGRGQHLHQDPQDAPNLARCMAGETGT